MSRVKRHAMIGASFTEISLDDDGQVTVEMMMSLDGGRTSASLKTQTMHPQQLADLSAAATTIGRLQTQRLERARDRDRSAAAESPAA